MSRAAQQQSRDMAAGGRRHENCFLQSTLSVLSAREMMILSLPRLSIIFDQQKGTQNSSGKKQTGSRFASRAMTRRPRAKMVAGTGGRNQIPKV